MSSPSLAQTLDRIRAQVDVPNDEYFYTKLAPRTDREREREKAPNDERPHVSCCAVGNQAERELHWHWQHSASELGERSAHESLIYRIQVGGGEGSTALIIDPRIEEQTGYRFQTARGLSARAVFASEREGRIRAALGRLSRAHYGRLELRNAVRKANEQIVGMLSPADVHLEPLIGHLERTGHAKIGKDGRIQNLEELVVLAGEQYAEALAAYEVAAGHAAPRLRPPPQAQPRTLIVSAGGKGASSRQLRLVPVAPAA